MLDFLGGRISATRALLTQVAKARDPYSNKEHGASNQKTIYFPLFSISHTTFKNRRQLDSPSSLQDRST